MAIVPTAACPLTNRSGSRGFQMIRTRLHAARTAAALSLLVVACTGSKSGDPQPAARFPGLLTMSVAPQDSSIPKGLDVQFAASGTFADGAVTDITTGVAWSSSDPSVLAFSTDAGSEGRASTLGTGPITVTATVDGIAASTTLTVLDATVASLDIVPDAPTILVGTSLLLTATATLTDDTTFDLPLVSWSSSDTSTVIVASDGTASGQTLGSATITAVEPVTGISASTVVTVTPVPGVLSYVSLKPGSVVGGSGRAVQGTVALTSPPTVSTTVDLASSDPVATIEPAQLVFDSATQLLTFEVSAGAAQQRTKVTITASADGVVKTATLRVRPAR